jgi:hypothetical protein
MHVLRKSLKLPCNPGLMFSFQPQIDFLELCDGGDASCLGKIRMMRHKEHAFSISKLNEVFTSGRSSIT